jgi:hypothetical protein
MLGGGRAEHRHDDLTFDAHHRALVAIAVLQVNSDQNPYSPRNSVKAPLANVTRFPTTNPCL